MKFNLLHLMRKKFFAYIFLACVTAFPFKAVAETSSASKPNIVFILVDDIRWDAFSCMGSPVAKNPNIDRIAKEGALFKNFFVSIPLCAPSRSSFLTGQYVHHTGVIDNRDHSALSHQLVTYPKLLHDAGYETGYTGKWHMGNDSSPRPGFDYWLCLPGQGQYIDPMFNFNGTNGKIKGYVTDIINEHAIEFIKQDHKKPFALYVAHKAVHGPFEPAERHKNLYQDAKFVVPPNVNDSLEGKPVLTREVTEREAAETPLKKKKGKKMAEKETARMEAKFAERTAVAQLRCLAAIDEGVGQIFKALEETKQLDNTIIVFSSDNGYFWGEHGLGDKRWAYEESIRDPLFIRYPKLIKPNTTFDQLVQNIDLAPTFLELGGVKIPEKTDGRSLIPLLKNPKTDWRKEVYSEYHKEGQSRCPTWEMVRTDEWKYIHYEDVEEGLDELYNLKHDSYEMKNLINEPGVKATLEKLKADLKTFSK